MLEALGEAQWFSILDLLSEFRQMQVKDDNRPKTSFPIRQGRFLWRVMPFGLTNEPASFTRLLIFWRSVALARPTV